MSQLNAITDGSDSIQDSELTILKNDLQQLIQLSEESLLELKKQQLFKKLNVHSYYRRAVELLWQRKDDKI